jgi:hypothetical protein
MIRCEEAMREAIKAVLSRYHQTRVANVDSVDFIMQASWVREKFWNYADTMQASG